MNDKLQLSAVELHRLAHLCAVHGLNFLLTLLLVLVEEGKLENLEKAHGERMRTSNKLHPHIMLRAFSYEPSKWAGQIAERMLSFVNMESFNPVTRMKLFNT